MHPSDHEPREDQQPYPPTAAPWVAPANRAPATPPPPSEPLPYQGQPVPGQPYPGQPYPAQPHSAQAGQPNLGPTGQPQHPGQPVPGQPQHPGQPVPGQPQHPAPPYAVYPAPAYPVGQGQPGPGQPGPGQQGPAQPGAWIATVPAQATSRRDRRWPGVVTAAAAAAVLASVSTAGLLGGFDRTGTTPVSLASLDSTSSEVVPVSGSSNTAPNWEKVAQAVRPSVVAIQVTLQNGAAEGSGVILDKAGHILTNNHVVSGAQGDLTVTLFDGRVYSATVVGTDPTTDLAVIKLTDPPSDLVAAVIGDSSAVQVGEDVMAVGNPLGLSSTVTTGIVSALDRPVSTSDGGSPVVTNAIQIDAAVNPGNSGGPLFDGQGKVIGITSSIASLSQSSGSIGLGFAIPSNLADRVAAELLQNGTASHAFLGVSLSDGTATADGVTRVGAVVEQVNPNTPASAAGLKKGDVIVAIDGQPAAGAESLTAYVRELASGQTAKLTVVRDGKAFTVDVTFASLDTASN